MKLNKTIICIILLLISVSLLHSCEKERKDRKDSTSEKALPGETPSDGRIEELLASVNMHHFTDSVEAPDFELNSLQGNRVALSQYRGKVVMLSFWATW